jgi:hypothetical protein
VEPLQLSAVRERETPYYGKPSTTLHPDGVPCAALGLINAAPSHNQAGPNLSVAPQNIDYAHG